MGLLRRALEGCGEVFAVIPIHEGLRQVTWPSPAFRQTRTCPAPGASHEYDSQDLQRFSGEVEGEPPQAGSSSTSTEENARARWARAKAAVESQE